MLILFLSPDRFHLPPYGQHIQHRYQQEKSPSSAAPAADCPLWNRAPSAAACPDTHHAPSTPAAHDGRHCCVSALPWYLIRTRHRRRTETNPSAGSPASSCSSATAGRCSASAVERQYTDNQSHREYGCPVSPSSGNHVVVFPASSLSPSGLIAFLFEILQDGRPPDCPPHNQAEGAVCTAITQCGVLFREHLRPESFSRLRNPRYVPSCVRPSPSAQPHVQRQYPHHASESRGRLRLLCTAERFW